MQRMLGIWFIHMYLDIYICNQHILLQKTQNINVKFDLLQKRVVSF